MAEPLFAVGDAVYVKDDAGVWIVTGIEPEGRVVKYWITKPTTPGHQSTAMVYEQFLIPTSKFTTTIGG